MPKKKKKEDEFYTMLKELAGLIVEAADEYVAIIHDYPETIERVPRMKEYETQCDQCVKKIMTKLYTAFITPFDREDISSLALAMDDITDAMYSVTSRLGLMNINDMREEAIEMADLTLAAVKHMQKMIDHLPDYKKDEEVLRYAISVSDIEDQGDTAYQNALSRLFHDDTLSGRYSVTWLRVFDRCEDCLDALDKASTIVRDVVMKAA